MYELSSVLSKPNKYQSEVKIKVKNKTTSLIFVIAKPEPLTELIAIKLKSLGYQLEVFHDGIFATIAIHRRKPDLMIIDWTNCCFTNFNIYCCLRSTNNYVPVIALTEDRSAEKRIEILNAGADYCLSKPFYFPEFMAIIQARLRQNKQKKSPILLFEDLKLNTLSRQVFRSDRQIHLTTKEFNLLEYLMQHPLQVLTRVQIIETIWGFDFMGDSNIIEVYIRYLRMKLEAEREKRLIHTVRSVGYVLRSQ